MPMKSNKQKIHCFQNRVAVSVATLLTLTTVSSFGSDYPTTVSSFNPVGYWRLNETTPVPVGDVATNLGSVGWIGHGEYVEGVVHPVTGIAGDGGGLTAMHLTNANTVVGQAKLRIPWRPEWNTNGP